jgi:hypothetical protein
MFTRLHTNTSETQESSFDTATYNKYMANEEQENWICFTWIEFKNLMVNKPWNADMLFKFNAG